MQRRRNNRHCSSHSLTKHPTTTSNVTTSPCMIQTPPCQRRSRNHIATLHPYQLQTRAKSEQNQSTQLSLHEPNMCTHTRSATYFFAWCRVQPPAVKMTSSSRPAMEHWRHPQSQHLHQAQAKALTSRVHSNCHGVEESVQLAAATHRHQKTWYVFNSHFRQQTNVYVSHIFGLLSTGGWVPRFLVHVVESQPRLPTVPVPVQPTVQVSRVIHRFLERKTVHVAVPENAGLTFFRGPLPAYVFITLMLLIYHGKESFWLIGVVNVLTQHGRVRDFDINHCGKLGKWAPWFCHCAPLDCPKATAQRPWNTPSNS